MINIELVQHFAYRGSSHWRKGAARHKIGKVWVYRSPIPVGRRWIFYLLIQMVSTCTRGAYGGGGGQHPGGRGGGEYRTLQLRQKRVF